MGIVLCLLTASALVMTAAWLFLLPYLGPIGTPLALAGIVLIKAGICLLWLRFGLSRPAPTPPASISTADLAPVLAEAERLFCTHKLSALTAALLAGLVAGARRN